MSMLAEPNCESAANVDAAKMWRDERGSFIARADRSVRTSLSLWITFYFQKILIKKMHSVQINFRMLTQF